MSEKTEQPTPKKIREAREKGDVAKSKDLTQTILILALFGYTVAAGQSIVESLGGLILMPFNYINTDFRQAMSEVGMDMMMELGWILLPYLGIVLVFGIFGEVIQTGFMLSFEAIKPSGKKLDVVANAQNIFSKKNLLEFVKSIVKIAILSFVIYKVIMDSLPLLIYIPAYGIPEFGALFGQLLKNMIFLTGLSYLVISVADLIWQRYQYNQQLMMSKDEVKQEYKGSEGDPQIKGQRKQLHQEMMQNDAVNQSREATVLITNPTHLAIALRYNEEETPLPMVLAKGEGALAERMIQAAREAGVPVMQNIPLAHSLFNEASIDQYIPSDLIEPVAAVLRLVRELSENSTNEFHQT